MVYEINTWETCGYLIFLGFVCVMVWLAIEEAEKADKRHYEERNKDFQ